MIICYTHLMYELMNRNEIMLDIAKKIKKKRLALNYTQEEFSSSSSVALSTYRTFEKTGKGSFENFIAIMTSLGAITQLEAFLPQVPFSPAEVFKQKLKKQRMRASKTAHSSSNFENKNTKSASLLDAIKAKNAES